MFIYTVRSIVHICLVISVCFIGAFIFASPGFLYTEFIQEKPAIFDREVYWFISFATSWLFFAIGYEIYSLIRGTYYIRKINEEEYEGLISRRLIRYTNNLTFIQNNSNSSNSFIHLEGRESAFSNYNMPYKYKLKQYIWFHQEDVIGSSEPDIKSFLWSHGLDKTPRKYKVIIDPRNLERDRIYIRPKNSNIVYKGKLYVKAEVNENFHYYNETIHFKNLLTNRFRLNYWHKMIHELIGIVLDFRSKTRRKIDF